MVGFIEKRKMAEKKLHRIDAAASLGGEVEMEETDLVSGVDVGEETGGHGEESSERGEESDQSVDYQGEEGEPAIWAGRVPLSQSLCLWRESREKERYVDFCKTILVISVMCWGF